MTQTLSLARWARASGTSALQTMLSVGTRPGTISFALGLPAPELFPTADLARAAAAVFEDDPRALQYAPPSAPLQAHVAALMRSRGVTCAPEQVFITAGAQQGIALLARLLLEPGGEVLTEQLCYTGFRQAVEPFSPRFITVPSDLDTGMDVDAVEAALKGGARPAFIYTVPNGHNPLGVSLSAEKRVRLVELARGYGVPIVEDDPYGFLSYDGPPAPPLRALDDEWVFHAGSFSKILAPGLRLGWLVVPEKLVPLLAVAKEASDINTATFSQRTAARYLDGGHLPAHLATLHREYAGRRDTMLGALEAHFPAGARWRRPPSGLFIWVELRRGTDAEEVLRVAMERERVVFVPGNAFAADGSRAASDCLRLNFSHSTPGVIEEGIARLARALEAARPRAPRMSGLAEAKPVHMRWARANGDYLEFVAGHPEYQTRDGFPTLRQEDWMRKYRIQPWPLFADAERRRELEGVALGVDGVMRGAIERFLLGSRPAEVAAFYAADNAHPGADWETFAPDEYLVEMLLEEPNGIRSAPSRADYIEDRGGLKLLEYNAGGFLGGIQADVVGERCAAAGPNARFLAERGLTATPPGTLRAMFRHVVEDTARMGAWEGGELNVAMMVHPHAPEQVAAHSPELYAREYRSALDEGGIASPGRVLICGPGDLVEEGGGLTVHGHRVHALMEHHDGTGDARVAFRCFKRGRLNLFTGPVGLLMCDKRNLALVSANGDSADFTAAEREIIRRHVPWTRRVLPGATTFRGRPFRLPEDLPAWRGELVLKKGSSASGRHVHVGRFRTPDEWNRAIARALVERDWVVQEYLETVPYCFHDAAGGPGRHDLVWGLFVFGRHYGGAFLRMQATSAGTGRVNTGQGAEVGVLLDLAEV
ncbi:MAG: Transcriptional regulator, GntR family domain / Aspartate aminotransferase [uncultured Gemmatimonadetes bacterium]|uniref:Transcriptional regulator, GntR family domain / Aspartate aminotransferase n=1 Tax=uncultured Gemmatimonadota bacterium TaxID=203437 RepID=A0A6J4KI63_9BACT|nr:MAG: Transcriptional regulator, GntR family domain / Aspartate aminotransferase [uncultured Gemmatimonadota bacterium]